MSLLIKNGTILSTTGEYVADIYVENDVISLIGKDLNVKADEVVDAAGKYVFPGGVDEHVHYGSFGGLLFDTADAAAVGGTTTIADFAPQDAGVPLIEAIERQAAKAKGTCSVDYAFHSIIMDPKDSVFEEIRKLPEIGVATLKLFMAYKGSPFYCDDKAIFKAMQIARDYGVTMLVHAENGDIINVLQKQLVAAGKTDPVYHYYSRPPLVETEATQRAIALSELAESPLFVVHVSTRGAMEAIRDAYNRGLPVYGETCTHYLTLNLENLAKRGNDGFEGAKYICSPALRPQEHLDAMWEGIQRGWLTAVGSDHCANAGGYEGAKKKGLGNFAKVPNGAPGVQDRLAMLWTQGVETGRLTKQKFVEIFATAPARMLGLPHKGRLDIGCDADIVVYDPAYRGKITNAASYHGTDYNAFEGFPMHGIPEKVYLRGTLMAAAGKFVGAKGKGRRQRCQTYGRCFEYVSR
ncbi:dihydropyrimidinase [Pyramidobacter piscolens]|uniref:dihydropyrimidinase n=1 Tax=Pyramidobacter piscolens TaxID=638849 RepID=UPI003AB489B0